MAASWEQELDRQIELSPDRYTSLLPQLLRIPTPRMQERQAVRFLAGKLEEAGCEVEVFEAEGAASSWGPPRHRPHRPPGEVDPRTVVR